MCIEKRKITDVIAVGCVDESIVTARFSEAMLSILRRAEIVPDHFYKMSIFL